MENYNDLFVVYNSGGKLNGVKEAIFRENLVQYDGRWNYNMNTDFRPRSHINAGIKCYPTANYVNYFGMANGYPIKDMTVNGVEKLETDNIASCIRMERTVKRKIHRKGVLQVI